MKMYHNSFLSSVCMQPASVTPRVPSAESVKRSEVSAAVNPMWWGDAVTSVPQELTALEYMAAQVSVLRDQSATSFYRLLRLIKVGLCRGIFVKASKTDSLKMQTENPVFYLQSWARLYKSFFRYSVDVMRGIVIQ